MLAAVVGLPAGLAMGEAGHLTFCWLAGFLGVLRSWQGALLGSWQAGPLTGWLTERLSGGYADKQAEWDGQVGRLGEWLASWLAV